MSRFKVLFFLFCSLNVLAVVEGESRLPPYEKSDGWKLALDKNGIKIFTRDWPESDFVAVKTEQIIRSDVSNILANYLDVSAFSEWVEDMRFAKELDPLNQQNERKVHMQMALPWPLEDRDVVIGQKVTRESPGGVVKIIEWNEGESVPEQEGVTRVPKALSEVVLVPLESENVKMIWQGHNEPGGVVPSFLVNWLIENVFYESSLNMRERFESPEYQKVFDGFDLGATDFVSDKNVANDVMQQ